MEPAADSSEAHFDLAISDGGMRLKLAETRLTLCDEGISYTLDDRTGLRAFSNLRSVRIQALHGGRRSPWEAMIELVFDRGRPLLVHSSSAWGANDPARDLVFIAFVEELHRRIPSADAAHIRFLRGIPEGRHNALLGILILFLAAAVVGGLWFLVKTADGTIPVFEILFPIVALIGFGAWIWQTIEKGRPGLYSPERLPRDLFP